MAQKNPCCRNGRVAPLSGQQTIPTVYCPLCPLRPLRHRPVAVDRTGIIRIFVVQTTD